MLIDWFTVIAQIVNFLILVWLLKRFLYQPILRALDAREKRIAAELAVADEKKREAEKEHDEFRQKNDEFEQQRSVLLSRTSAEAHAERKRLIAAARTDADELRAQWEEALKREYRDLSVALSRRIGAEVFAIARKVLADLANTTLEAHMADAFIERLRALSPEEKASLASITRLPASALPVTSATPATPATPTAAETAGILIRSAFDLPATQKNAIKAAIKEILDTRIPVRFEARPDLISGIELIANGHKVTWNIAGYLASLEEEIGKLLKSPGEPEPEAGLEPESEPELEAESELEAEPEAEASVKEKNRGKKKLNTPGTPNFESSEHIR